MLTSVTKHCHFREVCVCVCVFFMVLGLEWGILRRKYWKWLANGVIIQMAQDPGLKEAALNLRPPQNSSVFFKT